MLPLRLATQHYGWGVPASQGSKVLQLARANGVEAATSPDPGQPFSELWLGTHPGGGALVAGDAMPGRQGRPATAGTGGTMPLEAWLERHPEALGATMAAARAAGQPTGRLPFLMKVLSINKALPLQAHPTSSAAGGMHAARPNLYPDAAHKPEMVVSLAAGFCGFAGFLDYGALSAQLRSYPQLTEVLGAANVQEYLEAGASGQDTRRQLALAAMWDHLLLRTPADVASQVCGTVLKLMQDAVKRPSHPPGQAPRPAALPTGTASSSAAHPGSLEAQQAATAAALSGPSNVAKACDLALALSLLGASPGGLSQRCAMLSAAAEAWPGDPVGVLALMLLQDVVLDPGDAAVIPAGCPHAYICGEVLEVQAASNNTIKGGLAARGEATDKQGLVDAATGGLLQASGQASTPALAAGLSVAAGTAAASMRSAATAAPTSTTSGSRTMHEGPPRTIAPRVLPAPTSCPAGSLRLYQPDVAEFQAMHCLVRSGSKVGLVVDPGPGLLLVLAGSGRTMVRAAAVCDAHVLDEAELSPGTALFIAAGSSISISSHDTTSELDAWITTANSRSFSAAAAPPAGDAEAAGLPRPGSCAGVVLPDAAGGVELAATFTAAEQVAAGIMMGGAGSSCPANASDAAVAAAHHEPPPAAMQVDE